MCVRRPVHVGVRRWAESNKVKRGVTRVRGGGWGIHGPIAATWESSSERACVCVCEREKTHLGGQTVNGRSGGDLAEVM